MDEQKTADKITHTLDLLKLIHELAKGTKGVFGPAEDTLQEIESLTREYDNEVRENK